MVRVGGEAGYIAITKIDYRIHCNFANTKVHEFLCGFNFRIRLLLAVVLTPGFLFQIDAFPREPFTHLRESTSLHVCLCSLLYQRV